MSQAGPADSVPRRHVVIPSPVGELTLVAAGGALAGVYLEDPGYPPSRSSLGAPGDPAARPFAATASQLAAYFSGQRTDFDLPLVLAGTPFQQRVWSALRCIPYGTTVSYGQLARRLGMPRASRAVGHANARNPISIIVPCHRLIGTDGSLTGYGGGLDRKRFLLDLEQQISAGPAGARSQGGRQHSPVSQRG